MFEKLGKRKFAVPLLVAVIIACVMSVMFYPMANMEMKGLPFAMLSLDEGVEGPQGTVNAGDALIENVTAAADAGDGESPIAWTQVGSQEELDEALENGEFYGALIVPEGFSVGQMAAKQAAVQAALAQAQALATAQAPAQAAAAQGAGGAAGAAAGEGAAAGVAAVAGFADAGQADQDAASNMETPSLKVVVDNAKSPLVASQMKASMASMFQQMGVDVEVETIHEGDRLKVYVVEVRRSTRGPQVLLSRTHPGLVKRLFELEIPEIYDGTVEVKSIAREAGSRTKIAVWSAEPNVDPIGACVGPGGARVNSIVEELHGEKVDIIKYSEDPAQYVAASLSPADVLSVDLLPDGKSCRVVVPDDQLSLAIGKEGQNARLAAKLTGFKIDIKPASDPGELPDPEEDLLVVDDGDEPAEELLEEPVGEAPEESSNDIQV